LRPSPLRPPKKNQDKTDRVPQASLAELSRWRIQFNPGIAASFSSIT
jgi:hypothetical protein